MRRNNLKLESMAIIVLFIMAVIFPSINASFVDYYTCEYEMHTIASGGKPVYFCIDDINNDSYDDFYGFCQYGYKLYWYENLGSIDGNWTYHLIEENNTKLNAIHAIDIGDLDDDGDKDIVYGTYHVGSIGCYLKNGTNFTWHLVKDNVAWGHDIKLCDIDGDDDLDIAFGNHYLENEDKYCGWLENPNDFNDTDWDAHILPTVPQVAPFRTYVADLYGSGNYSLIWSGNQNQRITIHNPWEDVKYPASSPYDIIEDASEWSATNCNIENDSSDKIIGAKSMKMVVDDQDNVDMYAEYTFESPINLTGYTTVWFYFKYNRTDLDWDTYNPKVMIYDSAGKYQYWSFKTYKHWYRYNDTTTYYHIESALNRTGWTHYFCDFHGGIENGINLSNIAKIQIAVRFETGRNATIWWDGLHFGDNYFFVGNTFQDIRDCKPLDLDDDGDKDLLVTDFDGGEFSWYENDNGTWTKHTIDDSVNNPYCVEYFDVDRDGNNEYILSTFTYDGISRVYYYNSTYARNTLISTSETGFRYMITNDFDNDGDLDILLSGELGKIIIIETISTLHKSVGHQMTDILMILLTVMIVLFISVMLIKKMRG